VSLTVDRVQTALWLRVAAELLHRDRERLTELDKQIGDGDHGTNMDRGFQKVAAQLDPRTDPGAQLKAASMVLISTVGGASGPLYGTFFLRASGAVAGKETLTATDLAALCEAGLAGVLQRGRAQAGDKTMIDALAPAVEALRAAATSGASVKDAAAAAAAAAERGAESTVALVARKGRASYLGERSVGHMDPGAASTVLLLKALERAVG
jgi:phosphoenolpyruvate---glycerone phosphotransferase subunit DhaL